ncbi:MAG: prolyl oligopeptidase family serine peptidase [Proteobacteria bacterium]|nr:prolyl oligopeptidase family serine peptidase [Pseudomonadota bacterium]
MRLRLALFTLFALSAAASAQSFLPANPHDGMQAARDQIHDQTRGSVFPGPHQGETRVVWVWRPANAPTNRRLPTLYIFDGLDGLSVALLRLKPALDSGALPPILIIAPDPNPRSEGRGAEYLRGFPGGSDDFRIHEDWFVRQVVPWAQRTQRAATDPSQAFVAGFSNGADLSIVLANNHPELFGGALVHSPVGAQTAWITDSAAHQRWVVTGGTREAAGSVHRSADVPRQVIETLQRLNAPLRECVGPWRHEGPAWRDLSPGSLVWLMGLGDFSAYATEAEQRYCHTTP